ncbi:hypothetical protein [Sphingobacterium siyangense]|uniref:hypothetical protein n=1 Tax=Sphingobacterium siyangense TaxID=459529 RepID=UPI0028969C31|nr:hypothetical protein [Sphingobacterium siyangense]
MKNYSILLLLSLIFVSANSCKKDKTICGQLDMLVLTKINYLDKDGKDLLFGDHPSYPAEDLKIYQILPNGQKLEVYFSINRNEKFIAVNIDRSESRTFYIELKPDLIDKITFRNEADKNIPCSAMILKELKHNDIAGQYDEKTQVWIFTK